MKTVVRPNRALSILCTVHFYAPHCGGSEEVVRQVAERLAARGHDVVVATSADVRRGKHFMNGVEVVGFEVSGSAATGIRGDIAGYQDFLVSGDFDVVMNYHAAHWSTDLCLPLLEQPLRCPAILVTCGFQNLFAASHAGYFRKLPTYLKRYAALVLHSRLTKDAEFCERQGLVDVVVIPNGVALEEFEAPRRGFRERYRLDGRPLVLAVSNHYRYKGHRRLFDLAESLGSDALLCLIGERGEDGGCYYKCLERAEQCGVPVLSGLSRNDVVAAFREAALFVHTSDVECAPLVILEAMAAETPWVALDAGNVRELEGGRVCATFPELVASVKQLLADRKGRRSLGREGRAAVDGRHDWERIVNCYEELFLGVVASGKKHGA